MLRAVRPCDKTCSPLRVPPSDQVALSGDSDRLAIPWHQGLWEGGRRCRSPQHQVWHSGPPSSHAVLTALTHPSLLCPPLDPYVEGAVPPNPAGTRSSQQLTQLRTLSQGLPDPMTPLLTSCLLALSCFLSAPQLLANLFPSHPHPTFTTSPTTDPLHRLPGDTVPRGGFFRKLTSL